MKSISSTLGTALLVFGLCLTALSAVLLISQPEVYEATTRLMVEKDQSYVGSSPDASVYDPYWIQTEFEKIQSKLVLFQVISNLGLCRAWGARAGAVEPLSVGDAYVLLKGKMEVSQPRNTSLISITVRSEDAAEAAAIANETARVFGETRLQERRQLSERFMAALEKEVLKVQEEIKQKQEKVTSLEGSLDANRLVAVQRELQDLELVRDKLRVRIESKKTTAAAVSSPVKVLDMARVPSNPVRSNRVAGYCGLAAGLTFSVVGGATVRDTRREL